MTADPSIPAASSADAFQRVGNALVQLWPIIALSEAPPSAARARNLLLDACGSDYRPLVQLLLDIGASVRAPVAALGANGTMPEATWQMRRAPLVHQLVATRYLQPEVARWAVDIWGRALGVYTQPVVSPPFASAGHDARQGASTNPSTTRSVTHGSAAIAFSAPAAGARSSATVAATGARPIPAARANLPSWAGGPASFGVGAKVKPGARAALANAGRLAATSRPLPGPRFQPVEKLAVVVLATVLLLMVSVALWRALEARSAPDLAPITSAMREAPIEAPVKPPVEAPTAARVAPALPSAVRTPSAPPVFGRPIALVATAVRAPLVDAIATGVGGRYTVQQHVVAVDGSPSCRAVALKLGADKQTTEVIAHAAGTSSFRIPTRDIAGTLDRDGRFVVGIQSGITNNVNWQFRMRGRFDQEGFTAGTETITTAILRWGRTQSCLVTAELSAQRIGR